LIADPAFSHSGTNHSDDFPLQCVEGDQSLMLLPIVRRAVSLRLADESISVREAAVSLVGNYIAKSPLAIDGYHAALVPCLSDPGVSVRKRAMKIFQSIISDNPHFRGRSTVCNIMLQRSADPKEEDGVRDLIHEVFSVLWLRESRPGWQHPSIERSVQVQSEQGVVTPDAPVVSVKRSATELKTDMVAEQMMEVVQAAGTGTYLEAMLQKLLKGGIDSDSERKQIERQRRQELGQKQCAKLVDSLFELLVTIDEQRKIRENFGKDIAATLATIAVFANVAARPVLRRVETVLLYLKADNGVKTKEDEVAIVCASCDILFRLSPVFDSMEISKLSKTALAKDLSRITFTYGPTALVPAVRAFATLANFRVDGGESHFAQKLLEVAQRFYGFAADASSMRDFSPSNVRVPIVSCRLLC
jgi:cohesin loading factor subunit SCC2